MTVYLIGSDEGPVKIGHTTDPWQRLDKMQADNQAGLTVLALVDGGKAVETDLHVRFADAHIRGEWFARSPDVEAFIAANRAEERLRRPLGRPKTAGAATDNRVLELRLGRGMTQTQLGDAVGRDPSWVLRVESGRIGLSWKHALRLAEVFGVDPRDLFVVSPFVWVPWGTPDVFAGAA